MWNNSTPVCWWGNFHRTGNRVVRGVVEGIAKTLNWFSETLVQAGLSYPGDSETEFFNRFVKRMMQVVLFLPRGEEYWYTTGIFTLQNTFSRSFDAICCLFRHGSCPGSCSSRIIESAPCIVFVQEGAWDLYCLLCRACTPVKFSSNFDENRKKVMKAVAQTNVWSETEVVSTSPKLSSY
jgi:hypothetical protein